MLRILVLNPNRSDTITKSIAASLEQQRSLTRHKIHCADLPGAPVGIETDVDVAQVAPMVTHAIHTSEADAVVVACFSDPGVDQTRMTLPNRPVIGIAEAAYYTALQLGRRFGVLSLGPSSVARHAARLHRLDLLPRLVGDRAIGMTVAQGNRPESLPTLLATAALLRDQDGADTVILGCAGMGRHRDALQQALGLPVIDPVQAAVAVAITTLDLHYFPNATMRGHDDTPSHFRFT
ncbi:hydantoin racemase [Thioclava sp. SK-1]|uniref:aspartate/glutamate racemase family protein n=1 Tax=Thioclava sp. SK-1 TaxID=1889770 RepID=UPI000824DBA3|nr:aspartate/glutamate racemase family protein [Thioclava sp. SK-1]OCX58110.1 hydantoin racemase [Thioclava sp. SK-1]